MLGTRNIVWLDSISPWKIYEFVLENPREERKLTKREPES